MDSDGFLDPEDQELGQRFLSTGRLVLPVERADLLQRVQQLTVSLAAHYLGHAVPESAAQRLAYLNGIHEHVQPAELNALRMEVIRGLNAATWTRPALYRMAKHTLAVLSGSELAMQRRMNLSIQLPADDSSLLALHSDVWAGDSPYEVVLWLPLVDCFRTKAMYLIPPARDAELRERFAALGDGTCEDLFQSVAQQAEFVAVKLGEMMLFSQALAHGNRINQEGETRWSINVRFKGLYTPYGDKGLGSFFEPITLCPLSRIGLDYLEPGAFDE